MKSFKWLFSYVVVAFVGLGMAFMLSFHFLTPAHSQTPSPKPSLEAPPSGDLPPDFASDTGSANPAAGKAEAAPAKVAKPSTAPPAAAAVATPPPAAPKAAAAAKAAATPVAVPAAQPAANGLSPEESAALGDEATAPAAAASAKAGNDDYVYDPTGRRDPFKPYHDFAPTGAAKSKVGGTQLEPLQRWDVERLKVIGILWDVRNPRAMLKDPDGAVYTVVKNTRVGRNNGFVAAIREGEVVVVQTLENEGTISKETKILELGN